MNQTTTRISDKTVIEQVAKYNMGKQFPVHNGGYTKIRLVS